MTTLCSTSKTCTSPLISEIIPRESHSHKRVSQGRFSLFSQDGKLTWKNLATFIYQLILRLVHCLLPCLFKNRDDKKISKEIRSITISTPAKPPIRAPSAKKADSAKRIVRDIVLAHKLSNSKPPKHTLEPSEKNTSLQLIPREEPEKRNLAPLEKVPKNVLDHHLLPYLDARSLQSLSCTSNAFRNSVSESQKVHFHLPAQFSHFSKKKWELFTNVTTLALSPGTTNKQLHHIAKKIREGYFPRLTNIQLFSSTYHWVKFYEVQSGLIDIIQALPDLEALDADDLQHYDNFNGLTYELISALSHCKKLKSLHINWGYLSEETLENLDQLTQNWTELETLIYNNKCGKTGANRKFVQTLVTNCPNLKKLDLYYIDVDEEIMRMISENCSKLESLNVSGVGDISDNVAIMTQLAKGCPGLRHFNSYGISAPRIGMYAQESPYTLTDLLPLAEGCKNLEELRLDRVSITATGIDILNQFKLRSLLLYSCSNLSSDKVKAILDGQPALDELVLVHTDLHEPITLSKPHLLKKLVLKSVQIHEENLINWLSQMPELTTLVIENYDCNKKFSDALLVAIAKYCPNLRKLLVESGSFSKQAIAVLKESNKKLLGSEDNQEYGGF